MPDLTTGCRLLLIAGLLLVPAPSSCATAEAPGSVVVQEVRPAGTAVRAGLRSGDRLLSWVAGTAQGVLASPFDLAELEATHGRCGAVSIAVSREGREWTVSLQPGEWLIETRAVNPAAEAVFEDVRQLLAKGDFDSAVSRLGDLTADPPPLERDAMAWNLARAARALARGQRWTDARAIFERARMSATDESRKARIWAIEAGALATGLPAFAEVAHREAIAALRASGGSPLLLAAELNGLARLAVDAGGLAKAEELAREAWQIAEAAHTGSLVSADSLDRIVYAVAFRSHDEGLLLAEKALAIRQRLAPESHGMTSTLVLLGGLALGRGDNLTATAHWTRALDLQRRLDPQSPGPASTLQNLAVVAKDRGDHAQAEDLLRRAVALDEVAPGHRSRIWLAATLTILCELAIDRGDLDAAAALGRRALAIAEESGPDSVVAATLLGVLGEVARQAGRLSEARALHERSLASWAKISPNGYIVATHQISYARALRSMGDASRARETAERALPLLEQQAAAGVYAADALQLLGDLAREAGDLPRADALYGRALAIRGALAPGSWSEAETLHALGITRRAAGDLAGGLDLTGRAVDALDRQRGRIGGSYEARSRFAAKAATIYRDHLDLLLERGDTAGAFHALERSRARAFLDLMSERELDLSVAATPTLDRERRVLDVEYERTQASLADAKTATEGKARETAVAKLREIRDRRDALIERIRRESPRLAAIQYPRALGLAEARAALDAGTVFLAYVVEEQRALLFVVEGTAEPGPGLHVFILEAPAKSLREAVAAFRKEVALGPSGNVVALRRRARELYALLVGPAEPRLARARRIAVSADGPLHLLPFAALLRKNEPLVAWKPIHMVPSATAYAELARRRQEGSRWERDVVALGDPASRRGEPLPASGREVRTIAALFPGRAEVLLGREATEDRVKDRGARARYLHLAGHGLLDRRFPLNSAIALTPSAPEDSGLLQAWEVLEQVRLDAELVTLSACETGLGEDMGGEGLLGLTRAFLHAGARTVAASLWSVSDRTTGRLMRRFYGGLARGEPKDEALRAAQLELIKGGKTPFYWAAFHLAGDWR